MSPCLLEAGRHDGSLKSRSLSAQDTCFCHTNGCLKCDVKHQSGGRLEWVTQDARSQDLEMDVGQQRCFIKYVVIYVAMLRNPC
jgi:hypothetical protein